MSETPLSDDEFRKLHDILQQLALAAYPNPERKECPGTAILREVAGSSFPAKHPAYEHVKHCSPCLREMLDLQEQEFVAHTRQRYRRYRIVAGASSAAAITVVVLAITVPSGHSRDQIAVWNLQSAVRGTDEGVQAALSVARREGTVELNLPFGSDAGAYDIEIRRSDDSAAIQFYNGTAVDAKDKTRLSFIADFRHLEPGSYVLAYRRHDHSAWHRAPLVIN